MGKISREIAIEQMPRIVEGAMSHVVDWWIDLPPPMNKAIEQFRTQLEAAINSVDLVTRALGEYAKLIPAKAALMFAPCMNGRYLCIELARRWDDRWLQEG